MIFILRRNIVKSTEFHFERLHRLVIRTCATFGVTLYIILFQPFAHLTQNKIHAASGCGNILLMNTETRENIYFILFHTCAQWNEIKKNKCRKSILFHIYLILAGPNYWNNIK